MTSSPLHTTSASCRAPKGTARGLPTLVITLGAWLALVACTTAPTAIAPASEAAPPAAPPGEGVLEATRSALRSSTEWLARGVDNWFGDKPFDQGGSVSEGRLSVSVLRRRDTGTDVDVRLKARFRLPNLEAHSGYLFFGRDNPQEVVSDTPETFSRQQRQLPERAAERSFFAGVGFALREQVDVRLGVRGGLKPYAQARYRRPWALGRRDQIEFRQTLFWSVADHLGSTTALAYEHAASPTLALRWLNAATVTQVERKVEWSSSLGAYKLLHQQRQMH